MLLVGPPGTRKTTFGRRLARRLWRLLRDRRAAPRRLWGTSADRIIAGTIYLGEWQRRCLALIEELEDDRGVHSGRARGRAAARGVRHLGTYSRRERFPGKGFRFLDGLAGQSPKGRIDPLEASRWYAARVASRSTSSPTSAARWWRSSPRACARG